MQNAAKIITAVAILLVCVALAIYFMQSARAQKIAADKMKDTTGGGSAPAPADGGATARVTNPYTAPPAGFATVGDPSAAAQVNLNPAFTS